LNIFNDLKKYYLCQYDEKDSIGRRYRRQDAIGTPYCITVDGQTLEDNTVTIRERDSMLQDRISVDNIRKYLHDKLNVI
ncbi:MAG TPA: glycine--tRNA ligase, partial [Bacteroidales bacterium]|nr:glycine--tRNA ligase [Bacteroidales bacterium]